MSTVDPVILDLSISEGSKFGPMYNTVVIDPNNSGFEQRIQRYAYPRHKGDLSYGVRTQAQMQGLLSFFHARQGMTRGFLFWDNRDNSAVQQAIGSGDGVTRSFQLCKTYSSGGTSQSRKITRPLMNNSVVEAVRAPLTPATFYQNEIQQIDITGAPTGGYFTLSFSGQTTTGILPTASATTVQNALNAFTNGLAVTCSGGPLGVSPVVVRFVTPAGDQPPIASDNTHLTGGTSPAAVVSTVLGGVQLSGTPSSTTGIVTFATAPYGGDNEVQTLSLSGSGTFALTYTNVNGTFTTDALSTASTASQVQTALNALSNAGAGSFSCSGGPLPGSSVDITFSGPYPIGSSPQNLLILTHSAGVSGTLGRLTSGRLGPVIAWTGNFLVPVRFDTDYAPWDLKNVMGSWDSINIIEVRE